MLKRGDFKLARQKVADELKCRNKNVSFDPRDYDRLVKFCQIHPFQPSISAVVRVALKEYLDKEYPKICGEDSD